MIKFENLSKCYGDKLILSEVSFDIKKGDILGVMGRNGAGKTTLIKTLLKEVEYSGTISVHEKLLHSAKKLNFKEVFLITDTPHTYGYLTGIEYIQFILELKEKPKPDKNRLIQILDTFGISETESYQLIKDYSFGMKRKIVLIAGFLSKPLFMILDEPTIGLDTPSVITMKKLITAAAQKGMTFLITSHDPNLISEICSSVIILNEKKIGYQNSQFKNEEENLNDLYMKIIGENVNKKITDILNIDSSR